MKTTVELPNDLLREVKISAINHGRKLKEEIAFLLQKGLSKSVTPDAGSRQRVCLPIIPKGKFPVFDLDADRIHELEMQAESAGNE